MAGLSLAQRAKRALVTLLLALAEAYGLEVAVSRESADADIQKAFRKVARRVHPCRQGWQCAGRTRSVSTLPVTRGLQRKARGAVDRVRPQPRQQWQRPGLDFVSDARRCS